MCIRDSCRLGRRASCRRHGMTRLFVRANTAAASPSTDHARHRSVGHRDGPELPDQHADAPAGTARVVPHRAVHRRRHAGGVEPAVPRHRLHPAPRRRRTAHPYPVPPARLRRQGVHGLRLTVHALGVSSYHSIWRYGEREKPESYGVPTNLGGTARTLDEADGTVPLEPGLVSVHGITTLDDSASLTIDDGGWFVPRPDGTIDEYVFAYGRDFAAAIKDFYALAGPQPLLPRFALGNWWSRYHRYTDTEYKGVITAFEKADLPFSVGVIDMDWHVTEIDPSIGSGWTGYTWNPDLFPDPPAFLAWLHEHDLKVSLNVHPADGILRHEESYERVAEHVGIDPASGQPVRFDLCNPAFREAYFDLVHHPREDEGVDFWWLDWQQGHWSTVPGLDPLWLLNHLHYLDSGRNGKRPLTFSRYAGPGSHRYPVGFSGDTAISWATLDFQPYFTATASNIGYGWWSHDIGGHMFGSKDDELATRWVQLGVFSPIMRLHSSLSPFNSKEPWRFGDRAQAVMTEFLRLRHRLLPYLHTMNHRAAREGSPLVEPMYWRYPESADAYRVPNQFRFGTELLVAPITTPTNRSLQMGSVRAWLPEGTWVDVFTGLAYAGGRRLVLHRDLSTIPVLAPAGAIVPLSGEAIPANAPENPDAFEVRVVVGADGGFELIGDDGTGTGLDPAGVARTPIAFDQSEGVVTVGPASGALDCLPGSRSWTVTFLALTTPVDLVIMVDRTVVDARTTDGDNRMSVTVDGVPATSTLQVGIGRGPVLEPVDVASQLFTLLDSAFIEYEDKQRVYTIATSDRPLSVRLSHLQALELDRALEIAVGEILLAGVTA